MLPQGRSHIREVLRENGVTVGDLVEAPWLEGGESKGQVASTGVCNAQRRGR